MTSASSMKALLRAIEIVGSQRRLAKELGIVQQAVNDWVKQRKSIPLTQIFKIEHLTNGKVTARELRPDIFVHEKK